MWSKVKTKQKKVKKVRDPAEPRKPLTAFFIYQGQMRQELMKAMWIYPTRRWWGWWGRGGETWTRT